MSASAAPAGLLSSPGGMSDVRGTLPPPGLPLSDPPRVSGSYGIPSLDPIFGMSSGSLPCEILDEFQYQLKLQLFLHLLHQELEIHLPRSWLDRVQ